MRVAYFHEDDYCQIELVPDDSRDWCLEQARLIEDFSNKHREGVGWTDMYVRPPNPIELVTRQITSAAFVEAVKPHLSPFDSVTTGYSTHREGMPNTMAFGIEPDLMIFAEQRQSFVSAIWLMLQPSTDDQVEMATAALSSLSKWNLVLVDWGWRRVIQLHDPPALRAYLKQRAQVFSDLYSRFEHERQESKTVEPKQEGSWLARCRRWLKS